ncbi:MAG: four helix bundle protein [Crocinitomicaceae bacterium]
MYENQITIQDRSFNFSVKIVEFYKSIKSREDIMSRQLLRSVTSVGANSVEADNAQSKADFIAKMSIAQKEAAESVFWIKLLYETNYIEKENYVELNDEATRILKIIKAIIIKSKQNTRKHS